MKIKKIFIIILITFSSLPLILSQSLTFIQQEETIHTAIIEKLNAIATIQHHRILQYISSRQESLNLISSRTQLRRLLRSENKIASNKPAIKKIIDDILTTVKQVEDITIYSINKTVIYSTTSHEHLAHHQFYSPTYQFKRNALNIAIHRNNDDSMTLEMVNELKLDNKLIGYITVEYYADEFIKIIRDYSGLGTSGEIVLAERDNKGDTQFLTPTRHNKHLPSSMPIDKNNQNIPITHAMNGKSAVLKDYNDYRNVPVLAISRHIPETGWGMIVKIDYEEVFSELNNLKILILQLTITCFVLIILLALYLAKKLAEPICQLEAIADKIKSGENHTAPKSFLYEVDKLGQAFNAMVSSLLNSETFLHKSISELTKANIKLSSEAERFKRWKESNFIGIIHSDEHGKIIDANEALLNMIGYSKAELQSGAIDLLNITPKEFHHLDIAAIKEADEKGYWTPFEKEYIHKEGYSVPILIGGSIFKYDVKEYIVFIIDLSERNQQLSRLAQYKGIIENSGDLFAFVDKDYKYKTVNSAYLKAHGITTEDAINRSISDIQGKEFFNNKIKALVDQAIAGQTVKFQEKFNFKVAGERLLSVTYTPYIDENNNILGFIFKGEDITELEEHRQIAEYKNAEYKQLIYSMLEGIITTDEIGTILSFNPEASDIFGYSEQEVVGANISILMPKEQADKHDQLMSNYLLSNKSTFIGNRLGRDVTALHKDNHTFPLRIAIAKLPKASNGQEKYIANCQDLSEIEQQKDILNRSLKMDALGKVSGGIAHDFNNILGIIVGYSGLLQRKLTAEDELRYLDTITHACDRGEKLTKGLLAFSKDQPTEAQQHCINKIILSNETMLQTMLTNKVALTLDLADNLSTVLINSSLFEDMLLNMTINASHAMPKGGVILIKTSNITLNNRDGELLNLPEGHYIKLIIKDSGSGIEKELLSKIFDPFFTTKDEMGSGLGLYQCYSFIKLSQGTIDVHSIVNEGTTFSIYFPVFVKATEHTLENNKPTECRNSFVTTSTNILVVDDEEDIRELNCEYLRSEGFNVVSCSNASDAIQIIQKQNIDLIITDVVMPKMGGIEFINHVKQLYPQIKYLYVSGYLDLKSSDDAKQIKPILFKPYKGEELIKAVTSLLIET